MYVYTGAHEGQRLERAAKMIIFFTAINKIAIIHILTDIQLFTYNSADIQACYLAKKGKL